MRRIAFLSWLVFALGTAACQDQLTQPEADSPSASEAGQITALDESFGSVSPDLVVPELDGRLADALDIGWTGRVINGNNYQCTAPTPVVALANAIIGESVAVELPLLLDLLSLAAFDLPFLEALLIPEYEGPQEYGYDGDFTNVIKRTERASRRFWDIFSDDIEVIPMKGSMVLDVGRVATVYESVFALDPFTANLFATTVRDLVLASQTLDGGNHPLFSFNAFAASFGPPLPDRLAMGDAILEGYATLGLGDVAARGIFAHEWAHHVQFEKGYFTEEPPSFDPGNIDDAERTRYTELMADAMAAYFLTHKRGAALNWWRVEQFLEVFFNVGDCFFQNPGHHGTPEQRLRTARWAFELAQDAQKQGHILSADDFRDAFRSVYLSLLIAPDIGQPPPDDNVDPGNSGGSGIGPKV